MTIHHRSAHEDEAPEKHLDACPSCMTRDNAPIRIEPAEIGVCCDYYCARCGETWWCSWFEGDR